MEEQYQEYFQNVKRRSDQLVGYFLLGYFLIGFYFASYYDTWHVAIGVGGLVLASYHVSRVALKGSILYQYVLSAGVGLFMAQFIYQMHGMFEMHFFAFIGSILLITYQNWWLQIPLVLVVLLHHATFGYLQYLGNTEVYFTELEHMPLETFVIHVALAAVIFFLCGLWSHNVKKLSRSHLAKSFEVGKLQEANLQKEVLLRISDDLRRSNEELREAQKLARIGNWSLDPLSHALTWSEGLRDIYGLPPNAEADRDLGVSIVHPNDRIAVRSIMSNVALKGESAATEFRIIRPDGQLRVIQGMTHADIGPAGEMTRMYGVVQDVTERKQALATAVENKEINDSIRYTQRLQKALFPAWNELRVHFQDAFVLDRPKNIVGGDFHRFHAGSGQIMIACVDCTGHGVPGAFMSLLGFEMLNKVICVEGESEPSAVLERLDFEMNRSIGRYREEAVADGMDLTFCTIAPEKKMIRFAGAMGAAVLVSNGHATVIKGDRFGIGGYTDAGRKHFQATDIPYQSGDMLYMFTDGMQDQFGGPRGRKLQRSGVVSLLQGHAHLPAVEQQRLIVSFITEWQGDQEQTDDLLLIGLRL